MNLHTVEFRGSSFIFDPESVQIFPARGGDVPLQESGMPAPLAPPAAVTACDRIEILVNTTQECNLACPYCFVHQGRFSYGGEREKKLSPDLARQLVRTLPDAIVGANEYNIHFYGGEPLMNQDAIEAAVTEAQKKNGSCITFSITTNGTADPETAVPLLERGNFAVILSIDGPAPVHDAVRPDRDGNPTHAKVLEFLGRIREHGTKNLFVRGSSVVRHGWRLRFAEEYLGSLPVDAIKAQAVRLPAGHPLSLTREEREQYFRDLEEIAWSVIGGIRGGKPPLDDRFSTRVLQLICRTPRASFCGAGTSIFGMSCDGTIYPCVLHAGNIALELGHISDPDHGWVEKGRAWARSQERRDECKKCWALPLCGGGCPAMLSVCGEDECEYVRKVCELSLAIYGSVSHKPDLLVLAGIS